MTTKKDIPHPLGAPPLLDTYFNPFTALDRVANRYGSSLYQSFSRPIYAILEPIFLGTSQKGFTAIVVLISFFFGLQVIILGIIGEYIGRIYEEVKGRPLYIVDDLRQG